jgi:hypothetical protein
MERSAAMMETRDYASERYSELVARGLKAARMQRLVEDDVERAETAERTPRAGWFRILLAKQLHGWAHRLASPATRA